ncbi:MAG: hypothetical protein SOZ46_04715 [Bullifex sp.]|nr:hypothetical protein [Bullifex sp.]
MSEICTRLPLKNNFTKEMFIQKCITWVTGSYHYGFKSIQYDVSSWKDFSVQSEKSKAMVQIKPYMDESRTLVGFRLMSPEEKALWISDCIYIDSEGKKEVLVQLDRKNFGPAEDRVELAKKPHIVKMFLDDCCDDGGMDIDDWFIKAEDNVDLCAAIINGLSNNTLPVVYLSCDKTGRAALNPKYMAKRLGGLAHVICESNIETSYLLKEKTYSNNPHTGYVGVFWPGESLCKKYRLDPYGDTMHLEHEIIDYIVQSLVNKLDFSTETFQRIAQLQLRQRIMLLSSENRQKQTLLDAANNMLDEALSGNSQSDDLDNFIASFDQEVSEYKARIKQLENERNSLQSQVDSYKDAFNNLDTVGSPIYELGQEPEFYVGECRDLITDILQQVQNKYDKKSHAYSLISSLIEQNPKSDANKKMLERVKRILSSGDDLNGSMKQDLKSLGFEIDASGTHYTLTYMGDPRFAFTLAKTGSDSRNGKNIFSDINRYLSVEKHLY